MSDETASIQRRSKDGEGKDRRHPGPGTCDEGKETGRTGNGEAADYIGEVHGAANAAYIVRACNNFEELLSVAKILLADCEENIAAMGECDHSVGICLCGFKSNVAIAKEVIQKAEATE